MEVVADKHFSKGRSYVSHATCNLLKHFEPRPSDTFSKDPSFARARVEARAKAFEGLTHLYRHIWTWGISHLAIDSIALPNFIYFYLSVMEVVDAHWASNTPSLS